MNSICPTCGSHDTFILDSNMDKCNTCKAAYYPSQMVSQTFDEQISTMNKEEFFHITKIYSDENRELRDKVEQLEKDVEIAKRLNTSIGLRDYLNHEDAKYKAYKRSLIHHVDSYKFERDGLRQKIKELEKEIDHIKQIEFPKRIEKITNDNYERGRKDALEEIDKLVCDMYVDWQCNSEFSEDYAEALSCVLRKIRKLK